MRACMARVFPHPYVPRTRTGCPMCDHAIGPLGRPQCCKLSGFCANEPLWWSSFDVVCECNTNMRCTQVGTRTCAHTNTPVTHIWYGIQKHTQTQLMELLARQISQPQEIENLLPLRTLCVAPLQEGWFESGLARQFNCNLYRRVKIFVLIYNFYYYCRNINIYL